MSEINISNPILVYGEKGLSIKSTAMSGNDLIVTLSDDTTVTAANVKGAKGDTGVGIQSAALDANGFLVITLTDNSTITTTESIKGPQGPAGSSGADVVDGDVTDNQITLTKSDGSTVQLTGQINAASEAVGDVKLTARNDVSSTGYLTIPELQKVTYDKNVDNNLGLWNKLKVYNDKDYLEFGGVAAGEHIADFQTCDYFNYTSEIQGICQWHNKWIRIIYLGSTTYNTKYCFCLQVSDSFSFNTYVEYVIPHEINAIQTQGKCIFYPEQGKIIFFYSNQMVLLENIDEFANLNNYNIVELGGVGNLPQLITFDAAGNEYIMHINLNKPSSDVNCQIMIHTADTSSSNPQRSKIYITELSNVSNIKTNLYSSIPDLNALYGVTIAERGETNYWSQACPKLADDKLYFFNMNDKTFYSLDITTNTLTSELVGNSAWNDSKNRAAAYSSCINGNMIVGMEKAGDKNGLYTKKIGDTSFTKLAYPNPADTITKIEYLHYNPTKNIIVARAGADGNHVFYVTFDGGINWSHMLTQATIVKAVDSSNNLAHINEFYGELRFFSDSYIYANYTSESIYSETSFDYLKDSIMLMRHVETGYSDLFDVQPLYINSQIKAYAKK